MSIVYCGASHHTMPVGLRERLSFGRGLDRAVDAARALPSVDEAVVVSTCNRAEVYVCAADGAVSERDLVVWLAAFHDLDVGLVEPCVIGARDADAARHLFRVAAGLESLVTGEPQILGQVKAAYSNAVQQRATGPVLNRLFHWAFLAGKRARHETAIAEGAVSVSSAAAALAREELGDLAHAAALVVGTGEMGRLAARHLMASGIGTMTVVSRTPDRGRDLAAELGARSCVWEALPGELAAADLVVTATRATAPVLTADTLRAWGAAGRRRLVIVDIAVPRDVDPAVAQCAGVRLFNIDDLEGVVRRTLAARAAEIDRAAAIVEDEVARFEAWYRSLAAVPIVVALRDRFDEIRRRELVRLGSTLTTLSPEARAQIEEITRVVIGKLLTTATSELKAAPDAETLRQYGATLGRLFDLEPRCRRRQARAQEQARVGVETGDVAPQHEAH